MLIDIYTFYWLWFLSTRKLSYSIDSLFSDRKKLIHYDLRCLIQVKQQSNILNNLSKRLSAVCFIFGVVLHASFISILYVSNNDLPLLLVVMVVLGSVGVFIGRLIYFLGAAIPLQKSISLRDRVYRLLYHEKNLSWNQRRHLLSIIKSQRSLQTKIAFTAIDGRLIEKKLLSHHISYSLRVLML